ncbi:serine carboxypeptidase-like 18 [Prosopis cineraria]|uniref:serine carboxypeptidase-like 18 n=1 Tax=Prosopis cineraria TaxID=364024 RepID=UPI00240F5EC5|nr:serine carboxypeptidase-like 18 [Prosopis cineraria]
MRFTSSLTITPKWLCLRSLLLLVLSANTAFCGELVKSLPGFDGQLPFKLQTGYVSVNDSELFYYFIESQGDPETDPFFFWFSGGPGCSSFNGLAYEIGPIQFDIDNYNGGLPRLLYYPYTWTETASFVFVDSPVGTGFSYSTSSNWKSSDTLSAEQAYQFVRKWLEEHPKYLHLRLFIGGDSYSGMIVPLITQKIVLGNDAGLKPHLNLTGYLVGSPITDMYLNSNSRFILAHRLALISDQLYEKLKSSCKEDYVYVDPNNTACQTAISQYEKNVQEIWSNNILVPNCAFASRNPYGQRRLQKPHQKLSSDLWCWAFNYTLSYHWANDPSVQEALHVREGKVKYWERCNQTMSESYIYDVETVVEVHRWLSRRKLEVLVNGGDRDLVVPYVATDTWLKILNLTVSSQWRPWYVDDQVAGYTRKYDEETNGFRLTYATLKGAGHTAPEYSRKQCYEMFQRWLHFYPL